MEIIKNEMCEMPKYELRVKIRGKYIKEIIETPNIHRKKLAEKRIGGKAMGAKQVK